MTREEAIKKLKEAKELRDLDVISHEEYNSLLEKYKPLLLDEKSSDNTIPSNHSNYVPEGYKSVTDSLSKNKKTDSTTAETNTKTKSDQNNKSEKNSTSNTTGTILWLIFFFPVGLYKMWNRRYWTKRTRWIITIIIGFFVIGNYGNNSSSNYTSKSSLIGKGFGINDYWHRVKFNSNSYKIYQNGSIPSCVGYGNWTYERGVITLSMNDSRCESTSGISGKFKINDTFLEPIGGYDEGHWKKYLPFLKVS